MWYGGISIERFCENGYKLGAQALQCSAQSSTPRESEIPRSPKVGLLEIWFFSLIENVTNESLHVLDELLFSLAHENEKPSE